MTARKFSYRMTIAALTAAVMLSGCQSAQDKANEQAVAQAKQQAAASGVAQQVVATDKDGNTITTVVQPPQPGQTTQQITVTKTKTTTSGVAPAQPLVAPAGGANPGSANMAPLPNGTAPQPAPGAPVITPVDVQVPAGTTLSIRVNQRISVKDAHAGDHFSGEVVRSVMSGNTWRFLRERR